MPVSTVEHDETLLSTCFAVAAAGAFFQANIVKLRDIHEKSECILMVIYICDTYIYRYIYIYAYIYMATSH